MATCETCGALDIQTPCPPWQKMSAQQCADCGTFIGGKFTRTRSFRYCDDCWWKRLDAINTDLGLISEHPDVRA